MISTPVSLNSWAEYREGGIEFDGVIANRDRLFAATGVRKGSTTVRQDWIALVA
jgi:hypothetical protein